MGITNLHGNEVLFLRVSSAVDERHPVAGVASTVDEVAQFAVVENLPKRNQPRDDNLYSIRAM